MALLGLVSKGAGSLVSPQGKKVGKKEGSNKSREERKKGRKKETSHQEVLCPALLFLGSGPVGDDDLWYHHIPGTLRSLYLFSPSPLGPPIWL